MTLWPELRLASWSDTAATLHMWTQIVGKVRMALAPPVNHFWHVPLYVTACGLGTSAIPYGSRSFEIDFDFLEDRLSVRDNAGAAAFVGLYPRSVADFYAEFLATLQSLDIHVKIWPKPVEVPDPIPFPDDTVHASYDADAVRRFHRVLLSTAPIFESFRGGFLGKNSPVHFFWGSFDLAVTRFSGRRAPAREGADPITREAYSHECSSAGFWPGGGAVADAAFYAYTAPAPEGYATYAVRPPAAFYQPELNEYILMYDDVRRAASPEQAIRDFLQSTYEAGANLAHWDRTALER